MINQTQQISALGVTPYVEPVYSNLEIAINCQMTSAALLAASTGCVMFFYLFEVFPGKSRRNLSGFFVLVATAMLFMSSTARIWL